MKYSEILLSAAFIIQLLFSTGANAEAYYTATYGEDYVPPFISKNANAVTGGLIFDLYKIIEEEVGIKIKLVSAPKNRESQLMEKGRVDFTCYASKSWTKNPDKYLWTDDKLFTVVNRVFYNKEKFSKIPTDVNSLIGRSVGTIKARDHRRLYDCP